MTRASYDPDSLLVGLIGRPHGLGGEMTLQSYNRQSADLAKVPEVILERGQTREVRRVRGVRRATDGWLLRLEGVDSRDQAAALTHVAVRVRKELLPPLQAGEFFVEDLLGCTVRTEAGEVLGTVDSVFWNGAQDVMSVMRSADGPAEVGPAEAGGGPVECLIPVVPEFVRLVDSRARSVIVAWEGDP